MTTASVYGCHLFLELSTAAAVASLKFSSSSLPLYLRLHQADVSQGVRIFVSLLFRQPI
jgi:hypothetical protein